MPRNEHWIEVDEQGRLILPPEVLKAYGIRPGAPIRLKEGPKALRLHRPTSHLAKVYVEVTSRCNLACRTCIRNAWEEPQGDMAAVTFDRLLDDLQALPSRPDVFFGGFGEPLLLPDIATMVSRAKAVAGRVELITNGILLDEQRSRDLIEAGLDTLWVSVDGATPEHYADVRMGAALPVILENITRFNILRKSNYAPEIGIAFVAMRKNIADLPVLVRQASRLGVSHFMVTNVFPYTEELCKEMLYTRSVDGVDSTPSPWAPRIDLPRMDINAISQEALVQTIRDRHNVHFNGVTLGQSRAGRCAFIEFGSISIAWNGAVSPCLALMHRYETYLNGQHRTVRPCIYGNLQEQSLLAIWEAQEYAAFRKRVQEFDFAPCTWCGGCEMAEKNEEDCFGNTFPVCGGCLWAQGVIQCP